MPERLEGLKVEQFAHLDDKTAMRSLKKLKAVDKAASFLEDLGDNLYFRMTMLGKCVRIMPENDPRVYQILRDVCLILDYDTIPEIYSIRSYALDIQPSGVKRPILLVPDFVLNNYDDSLLYFNFGRAVTRLKSGSLKFYIAAQTLLLASSSVEVISEPMKLAFANWMRKSELTADRGGLLACQNIQAAMVFLINKAGATLEDAKKVSYTDYLEAYKIDNQLAVVGKSLQTLSNCTGWANDRIKELFVWYASGRYDDLLEDFLD